MKIASRRVVTATGIAPATVIIQDGQILDIINRYEPEGSTLDLGDLILMPGLVDTHVHVNEPGRTDWEGFRTAGRAGAAGGITTMVVMPLNCRPPATSAQSLLGEARAAQGQCLIDYGFWGGIVPGNTAEIEGMWHLGALGFKCFLADSGVDDFPRVSRQDLETAMPQAARLGAVVLAHAEDPEVLEQTRIASGMQHATHSYAAYLASRPPEAELNAIKTMIELCRKTKARTHIVHVSAASALATLDAARREGLPLTTETCPHYLALAAEDITDGATHFKCAPPIRQKHNQDQLWAALRSAVLDMVVSDHSPCPPEFKKMETGDFSAAWGGISSLQLGLPIVWTHARARGFDTTALSRWMSAAPAHLAGLDGRKGRIAPGYDADLAVFDPDAQWTVQAEALQHRHKLTPYHGTQLRGEVKSTFLRARQIYAAPGFQRLSPLADDGFATEALGQWVKRTRE